jgi:hypothetical protein
MALDEAGRVSCAVVPASHSAYTRDVIPDVLHWLFWDVEPASVDLDSHADYVLERVMSRGDWAAMTWLVRTFSPERRAAFLVRKGAALAPRERAFWCLVSGLPNDTGAGGGRPPWAA